MCCRLTTNSTSRNQVHTPNRIVSKQTEFNFSNRRVHLLNYLLTNTSIANEKMSLSKFTKVIFIFFEATFYETVSTYQYKFTKHKMLLAAIGFPRRKSHYDFNKNRLATNIFSIKICRLKFAQIHF